MSRRDSENIDFDAVGFTPSSAGDDGQELPLAELYGADGPQGAFGPAGNIARSARASTRYIFYPTWRSQLSNLTAYFVLCVVTIYLSWAFPIFVIKGPLFSIGATRYYLYLPVLILGPGFMLTRILIQIYNCKYIIDERGVEAQVGLVSFELRQPRLRWEDIRGVEPTQNIWERALNIGSVVVGSAMNDSVEIVMNGVANPKAIQLLINSERDCFMRSLRESGAHLKHAATSG